MDPQTSCPLFKLPPELRDRIYEDAFGEESHHGKVPISSAIRMAPQAALALTCRRIHQEAIGHHQALYKAFWRSNIFTVLGTIPLGQYQLTAKHIYHMTRILIRYRSTLRGGKEGRIRLRFAELRGASRFCWDVACEDAIELLMMKVTLFQLFSRYAPTSEEKPWGEHKRGYLHRNLRKCDLDELLRECGLLQASGTYNMFVR